MAIPECLYNSSRLHRKYLSFWNNNFWDNQDDILQNMCKILTPKTFLYMAGRVFIPSQSIYSWYSVINTEHSNWITQVYMLCVHDRNDQMCPGCRHLFYTYAVAYVAIENTLAFQAIRWTFLICIIESEFLKI